MTDACRSNPLSGPPADSPGHLKQARAHWLLSAADVNVYTQQQILIFQLEIQVSTPTTVETLKLVVVDSYMSEDESSLFFKFLKHSLTF